MKKKSLKRIFALLLICSMVTLAPVHSHAGQKHKTKATVTCKKSHYTTSAERAFSRYQARYRKFISMSAYRNGAFWGYGKHARLSRFGGIDCSAYAADFAKYVFGASSPVTYGSHRHSSPSQIHSGDVVKVTGGNHWFVVLERHGDKLYTAEGNWNHVVVISRSAYRIRNGRLYRNGKPFRHFYAAYHYGKVS